jgi:hypothetical protein
MIFLREGGRGIMLGAVVVRDDGERYEKGAQLVLARRCRKPHIGVWTLFLAASVLFGALQVAEHSSENRPYRYDLASSQLFSAMRWATAS